MATSNLSRILVDVGNGATKLAHLPSSVHPLRHEFEMLRIRRGETFDVCNSLPTPARWFVSSVNPVERKRLERWIASRRPGDEVKLLSVDDVPILVGLQQPDRIGIDRLCAAAAAYRLRNGLAHAIVVDAGTAITVDLVSHPGRFQGGSILCGAELAARALAAGTEGLPTIDPFAKTLPPDPVGTSTLEALQSGAFWGSVGGVKETVARIRRLVGEPARLFVTGGAGHAIARAAGWRRDVHEPHLVLRGVGLAAHAPRRKK